MMSILAVVAAIELFFRLLAWVIRRPQIQDRGLRWTKKLRMRLGFGFPTHAVILAAGSSLRWIASIDLTRIDTEKGRCEYKYLHWQEIAKKLVPFAGPESSGQNMRPEEVLSKVLDIDPPGEDAPWHKSLAPLHYLVPLVNIQFMRYFDKGIEDITVVVGRGSEAQNQIAEHVDSWNKGCKSQVKTYSVEAGKNVTYSAFACLSNLRHSRDGGHIVMSFSDIVWEKKLLKRLFNARGDIIVMVDKH